MGEKEKYSDDGLHVYLLSVYLFCRMMDPKAFSYKAMYCVEH